MAMETGQNSFWLVTLTAFLVTTTGCGGTNLRPIDEEIARGGTGLRKEAGQRIDGYVLADGVAHEHKGRAGLAGTDSLALWTEKPSGETDLSGRAVPVRVPGPVFPLTSVAALEVVGSGNVVLIVGIGVVVALAVAFVIGASSMDLNSSDGTWGLTK